MRSDTKSWPDRGREPIRNNAGAVFSRGEAISLVTRIACRKVIKTGWSRSREVAMVISRQGRMYTLNVARTSSGLISRSSKIAECHRASSAD